MKLNILGHEEFPVTGPFAQGLLPSPFSKKMQEMVPQSRDELKYRVKKCLRQIKGEERKEANLKAIANTYIKQEEEISNANSNKLDDHDRSHDRIHDKEKWHSRHPPRKFRPFGKDEP